ncbi:pseudaminic acid cytidylyltransferase [Sphingorhabdus buctiana]|uniref:Pseudaminic acid cytidylyltransferase n=1 Tax=Sphingorhabdus buctiana TaxID=1508805 RepID=A0ABW4MAJ7_9SPHN
MKIAIIPARGGSKRIPSKNIKLFAGMPIIARPIIAALESGCFDRVIVSTDDNKIAAIAEEYGAAVPFIRPRELADDFTPTIEVVAHAIDWLNKNYAHITYACCIYATAPFLTAANLQRGFKVLKDTDAAYAFSVAEYPFPIQRALRITSCQRIEMFQSEHATTRSQDLEPAWHDAGQFYWGKSQAWLARLPLFDSNSTPVILSRRQVQDIDTPEDWELAEAMFVANEILNQRNTQG